ncbi:unnamed protein product, partial [Adineta ricciae]
DEANEPQKLKQDYLKSLIDNLPEAKRITIIDYGRTYEGEGLQVQYSFLTKEILSKLIGDIDTISWRGYRFDENDYKRVSKSLRICTKQNTQEVESLIKPVIKCLNSSNYMEVFENVELSGGKLASGSIHTNRSLAARHLFFMRECPEFLIQHHYPEESESEMKSLMDNMMSNTRRIFQDHLHVVTVKATERVAGHAMDTDANEEARIEALSYHIKLLNHFAMQRYLRKEFSDQPIIQNVITVLQDDGLLDQLERLNKKRIEFIGQSLTLLNNLILEEKVLKLMKSQSFADTCSQFRSVNDKTIQFTSHILLVSLNKTSFTDVREIDLLSKTYTEYLYKSVKVPKLCYHCVKLSCLVRNLKIIVEGNDAFRDSLVEQKNGISAIANCVSAYQDSSIESKSVKVSTIVQRMKPDAEVLEKIQQLAILIIWRFTYYGPTVIKTLKSNDAFIDQILKVSKQPLRGPAKGNKKSLADSAKETAEQMLWRFGSEKLILHEKKKKQEEITSDRPDEPSTADQWRESVPFDLLMSYSTNVNDKIMSLKIADRLTKRNYRVYTEKQGKHRLELMEIAAAKKVPILACLSSKFRDSKFCMAEIDNASKVKCPVIPIIVEENYTVKGWLNHVLNNRKPIEFNNTDFTQSFMFLIGEIDEILHRQERE